MNPLTQFCVVMLLVAAACPPPVEFWGEWLRYGKAIHTTFVFSAGLVGVLSISWKP